MVKIDLAYKQISTPLLISVGIIFVLIATVYALDVMSHTGLINSNDSANVGSVSVGLSESIVLIVIIVIVFVVGRALGH